MVPAPTIPTVLMSRRATSLPRPGMFGRLTLGKKDVLQRFGLAVLLALDEQLGFAGDAFVEAG